VLREREVRLVELFRVSHCVANCRIVSHWTEWTEPVSETVENYDTLASQMLVAPERCVMKTMILVVCGWLMVGTLGVLAQHEQHQAAAASPDCKAIMASDAKMTEQVAAMNRAKGDKKVELMASILTQMVEQRAGMMQHMMQMMSMGRDAMAGCPMMGEMKMKGMATK